MSNTPHSSSNHSSSSVEQLTVNTIRSLSMDAVQKANSGHPGMPMGMADVAFVLWHRFLKHNPADPTWFNRDRFILSAGHGSMLLYSLLHLSGYDLSLEDLKSFRQWGSKTPGHPEVGMTPGVEMTTGPLGQGFATGVGMAIAEHHLASQFNSDDGTLIDHYTYSIVSDGDLMEGISHEAASMAGHLKLGKLIYLYDSNRISIDGSTDLSFTENVQQRFEAYGWQVLSCDGHDREAISSAIVQAQADSNRPSLVICNTHIGFGSPSKQDSESSHGAPLGEEEVKATKRNLGLDPERHFEVPQQVSDLMREAVIKGRQAQEAWEELVELQKKSRPDLVEELFRRIDRKLPDNLTNKLPLFPVDSKGIASRKAFGDVLNATCASLSELLGGSADLAGSNNTFMSGQGIYSPESPEGRNIHYGVREHAMGAAMNGMALHGGVRPFGGTFLVFADYCRPAIRLAALSHIPVTYIFTHDSIGLGEDGPTHQPIEHLASLRAMPNVLVLRPADANEVAVCWKMALEHTTGPTLLILTRQNLPTIERSSETDALNAEKGAYSVLGNPAEANLLLIATGSEVSTALQTAELLSKEGIQAAVISMPSWERFRAQPDEWKEKVLPTSVKRRVSIEAAMTMGWREWTGDQGLQIGLDHFGASAPAEELFDQFGLTAERIATRIAEWIRPQ